MEDSRGPRTDWQVLQMPITRPRSALPIQGVRILMQLGHCGNKSGGGPWSREPTAVGLKHPIGGRPRHTPKDCTNPFMPQMTMRKGTVELVAKRPTQNALATKP